MSIHHDFEKIKALAIHYAKQSNCNYTVILMNPDENGNFSLDSGSTYEFVTDSYFERERPCVKVLFSTKELPLEMCKRDYMQRLDKLYPREPEVFVLQAMPDFDMPQVLRPENNQPWKNQNKKGRGGNRKY